MNTKDVVLIREICRLVLTSPSSINEIARIYFTSSRRVSRIKRKLTKLNLTWELIDGYGDEQLKKLLYPKQRNRYVRRKPDWSKVHEQMGRKCQTIIQIWEEYCLINPGDAYSYSQFTYHYAKFRKTVDVTMRMTHHPGECVFVDYAGLTIPWQDGDVERNAHVFVAVSGASNYNFSLACRDQSTESWIDAHNKMFSFFGGVHQVVVPDNLKAAVIKPGSFPTLNRTYLEMAKYYEITIAPQEFVGHKINLKLKLVYCLCLAGLQLHFVAESFSVFKKLMKRLMSYYLLLTNVNFVVWKAQDSLAF